MDATGFSDYKEHELLKAEKNYMEHRADCALKKHGI